MQVVTFLAFSQGMALNFWGQIISNVEAGGWTIWIAEVGVKQKKWTNHHLKFMCIMKNWFLSGSPTKKWLLNLIQCCRQGYLFRWGFRPFKNLWGTPKGLEGSYLKCKNHPGRYTATIHEIPTFHFKAQKMAAEIVTYNRLPFAVLSISVVVAFHCTCPTLYIDGRSMWILDPWCPSKTL